MDLKKSGNVLSQRLGDLLLEQGLINDQQLNDALRVQKLNGGRLGYNLVKISAITEEELATFLSKQYNVKSISLNDLEIDPLVAKLIPPEIAQKYMVIPIKKQGRILTLAMTNPADIFAIEDIKFLTGYEIEPVICSESSIRNAIDVNYDLTQSMANVIAGMENEELELVEDEEEVELSKLKEAVDEAPVVKLVNSLIFDAVRKGASDIHIEPYEKNLRVRFRIDGVLYEMMSPPYRLKAALISRIKIMAELDIAERRIPQDGRIKIRVGEKTIDIRLSTLPTLFGEKVVMRILDQSTLAMDINKLGFEGRALKDFKDAISRPYGMVLVTGPTGSGKSTTLYSALNNLNTSTTNIMTAEDPVEYNLKGINQVLIKEEIGLTFATALRAFLRQDPNIIMVGEIRDIETAQIAIKAALTGHLVLSTLHTNDAPSTINRLIDMGIEPFLVASSINLIVAQRLIRKLCVSCKQPIELLKDAVEEIGIEPEIVKKSQIFGKTGCLECSSTGYRGRVAIHEVLQVNEAIKELILSRASSIEIRKQAILDGMLGLRDTAIIKLKNGITSVEEVLKETTKER